MSTVKDSTGQDGAAQTELATAAAAAAKTPAVAAAKPTPSASGERIQEQLLRSQGYKLSMVNGQEKYCRREIPLGSRLATIMRCVTVAEAQAMAREGREFTERIQRNTQACVYTGGGSAKVNCGN